MAATWDDCWSNEGNNNENFARFFPMIKIFAVLHITKYKLSINIKKSAQTKNSAYKDSDRIFKKSFDRGIKWIDKRLMFIRKVLSHFGLNFSLKLWIKCCEAISEFISDLFFARKC